MHTRINLDKLKNKVSGRRSSESSLLELASSKNGDRRNSVSNPMIVISESREKSLHTYTSNSRIRAQSLSLVNPASVSNSRSRSRSVSKKRTKELIKQETAHVILKKLLHVLSDLGLQQPIPLNTTSGNLNGPGSKTSKIYVANTNDCVYLAPASSASFTYEDVENGGIPENSMDFDDDEDDDEFDGPYYFNGIRRDSDSAVMSDDEEGPLSPASQSRNNSTINLNTRATPRILRQKMQSFNTPNYLCTKIDADSPIPHTFAVIIELEKETICRDVNIGFLSLTNILWPSGDPYNKSFVKEKFKIGNLEWTTSLDDADYYVSILNTNDVKSKHVLATDLAKRTREYKLHSVKDGACGPTEGAAQINGETDPSPSNFVEKSYKPGIYVFLLPILLPHHIPPTINSIGGSLNHSLNITLNKISEKLNRKSKVCANYSLPLVRTPPSFANSTADKPIYVNRVWNDSLQYIITFPKKYVSLGAEHLINVKLVPLVKDVIIKRIKFNVLERITFVSKNLSREYDYDGDDPYHLKFSSDKIRERVVPICELKTKQKSGYSLIEPYKEEVIKCPDNNLLFSCYESEDNFDEFNHFNLNDPVSKQKLSMKSTMIASPLDINIALPFLTTKSDKTILTSSANNDDDTGFITVSNPSPIKGPSKRSYADLTSPPFPPSSPIIGTLETNICHPHPDFSLSRVMSFGDEDEVIKPDTSALMAEESNNHVKENIQQGFTTVSKALCPDSNFRHIQIHHRLQVCFRISKPDPNDHYKMHHYEVVVDTPLILLSAKCNDDSIQLPKYHETEGQIGGISGNNEGSITFRTPNFERNGVSIKPIDQYDGDQLPSFEEAVSATSSPITRSVSLGTDLISRMPSIVPNEPAPAYEATPSSVPRSESPLNIDQIVNLEKAQPGSHRKSRIRSSLLSSFAPTPIRSTAFTDSTPCPLAVDDEVVLADNTGDDSSGQSSSTNGQSVESSSLNTEESLISLNTSQVNIVPPTISSAESEECNVAVKGQSNETDASLDKEDPKFVPVASPNPVLADKDLAFSDLNVVTPVCSQTPADTSLLLHPLITNTSGIDSEQVSLYTQETQENSMFDQRLPLLENQSIDNLSRSVTNFSMRSSNFVRDTSKQLTDNLSIITEANQPVQDLSRTF